MNGSDRTTPPSMRRAATALAVLAAAVGTLVGPALAGAAPRDTGPDAAMMPADELTTIFSGATLGITQPDDLTIAGGRLFVGFQNGLGPQGQPSSTGAKTSTVVEMTTSGALVRSWPLAGHIDGLTADPATGLVVATVNEDLHSSLSTIDPSTGALVHYAYSPSPLPHNGGTDAISFWRGTMLVSASAPGTTGAKAPRATYPAVYEVTLDAATHVAKVTALFDDEATATIANTGARHGTSVKLALTDPDSNEVVPAMAPRFGGDFVLDSQGDKEQIYVHAEASGSPALSVLELSQSIDDTAWATAATGTLFMSDNANDLVDALHGSFRRGTAFVAARPCDADNAPSTCPGPGFPADYLGVLDMESGAITQADLGGRVVEPHGLQFVAG